MTTEEVDDAMSGTITLTSPGRAPPCYVNGDLEQGYGDIDGDGYITQADARLIGGYINGDNPLTAAQLIRADVDGDGEVTVLDYNEVSNYAEGRQDTFPICEAKGELVQVDIPASVAQGATYDVTAKVHNKGGATGTFVVRWYTDTVLRSMSGNIILAAGETSLDAVQPVTPLTAPTTGDSMTYNLRLIRLIAAE